MADYKHKGMNGYGQQGPGPSSDMHIGGVMREPGDYGGDGVGLGGQKVIHAGGGGGGKGAKKGAHQGGKMKRHHGGY